jgi:hypothetical protein
MTEMQTKQNNGATQIDFNAIQQHLEALNHRLIDLLGDKYAIPINKPRKKVRKIAYAIRCIHYFHDNEDHYDDKPSAWIEVLLPDGKVVSGCSKCGRAQVVTHNGELQPAPSLRTLSHNDQRLIDTLLKLGCEEVKQVNGKWQTAVAFPVTYDDGSEGKHYRVALEGKNKWRHLKDKEAGKAVFGLYHEETQKLIQANRKVIVTESPLDRCVLFTVGYPAIAVLGAGNANALACERHKETLLNLLGDDGEIFVWLEPDVEDFAQKVANALQRPVKVIKPPVHKDDLKKWKDAKRLWLDYCGKDWEKFEVVVKELLANATEIAPQPEPVFERKILKVRQRLEEAVWRPLGEITMPQNDRWLVEGLIKEGNLVILSARPKTAKSIVALNLAACVAMGKPFLDRSVTQGRALFVAYERHDLTLERALAMGLADCYDFMLWDKVAYGLPRVDCLDGWVDFIERNGVKLVVIDTLAHFLKPELAKVRNAINAYDHIYNVMGMIKSAGEETGCTFVLIHHDRKGETAETDEARVLGTTALTASPDAVFQLKSMSDKVICLKATGNAIEDTALYFRVGQDFWLELADKPATTKEEKAAKAIEDYLRQHGEATRQDLIRLLLETGLTEKEGSASMLLQRAFDGYLSLRVEKRYEGKQVVYRLKGKSSQPPAQPEIEPADSPEAAQHLTPSTPIEDVNVVNRQPDQPEPTLNTLNMFNTLNNDRHVKGVKGQADPDLQPDRPLTTLTNSIGVAGVKHSEPVSDPQEARPEPEGNPPDPQATRHETLDSPPEPERPVGDPQATVNPSDLPANEPENEFIRINSISANEPECDQPSEEIPPAQPFATLNEPVCPICGERLDPEPDSGLAACLGCGRLFRVEIPPTSPDDDDNPPDGNNGQGGFAPPEPAKEPSIPPETLNRITERLPDGSIKLELAWKDKTETVAPDDLKGWQPIEEIPEISLPNIESVEIPPVVVLDLETDGLDPAKGSISAAGLALYLNGKEVETLIIANKGNEADLLAQTFDYLRETCNKLGNVILTGYNIADFDLPYLIERARKLKVECPFRYLKDRETGEIKRWKVAATEGTLRGDPLDYPAIATDLPIKVIDTLHLVCRWDYTAKALRNYDLKSVAAYFNVNQPDRPILSPDQIRHAFQHDPKTFEAYLMADLRETYALFETHIKPYAGVAALTKLPIDQVATRSTAWVWQQILEQHYKEIPQPDEKRKYEGGLVVSRKGLWFPCLKVDIASLYPTIMLAYRIHSRKDPDQIALRWLKTLTRQRLELKAKAKAGDANAQILQEAMKILLNSLYGFYGTGGYGFNDMGAAAKVTEVGRKVLTLMIEAVEDAGGLVVEADTDGLIVCYRNADPQKILEAVNAAIPPVFKVEVEWQEAVCFVSDDKSYIVLPKEGDPIIKGSKWRGRDKEAYLTKAIPTFVRLWALEGKDAALAFALQTLNEIRTGQGWRWVIRSHRVSKADKFLLQAGFKVGEIATYAYKDKKRGIVAREPEDGYDCDYYAKQFSKTLKEVVETIDPAQTNEAGEMVGTEAPSLIFGSVIAAEVS